MQTSKLIITILITGLIAGTLDILAAIFLLASGDAARVLKFVASGVFGKSALEGGSEMAAWGLIFHYLIATSWTVLYFLIYPKLPFLRRNKWLNAIFFGAFVWAMMNLVVVPLSQIGWRGLEPIGAIKNVLILMFCIGLPISISADRFFRKTNNK